MATRTNLSRSNPRSKIIIDRLQAYSPGLPSTSEDEAPKLATVIPIAAAAQPDPKRRSRAKKPRKFTVEEAFSMNIEPPELAASDFHLERAIRAVAYLLHWGSDDGMTPIDGFAAFGLSRILNRCAEWAAPRPKKDEC
jgi:hypothetical protein